MNNTRISHMHFPALESVYVDVLAIYKSSLFARCWTTMTFLALLQIHVQLKTTTPITEGVRLFSFVNYIILNYNGVDDDDLMFTWSTLRG